MVYAPFNLLNHHFHQELFFPARLLPYFKKFLDLGEKILLGINQNEGNEGYLVK